MQNWQQNIVNTEARVREILTSYRKIAVVGMTDVGYKPSYYVPKYMMDRGYEVYPVNPRYNEIEGMVCYPDLKSIPVEVEIVDLFRRSEDVLPHAEEALLTKPKVFWMQSGIINMEAAEVLAKAGIEVVMDRCLYADHAAFFGRG
ncbi:MAG: CoA-binding protein [Blastocatellia bacterium]|nr:CoA-binding protein [Blastocatellia bacterium]